MAHNEPVNLLTRIYDDGHIISAGHDRGIRARDATTGANVLANFGPAIRNDDNEPLKIFSRL